MQFVYTPDSSRQQAPRRHRWRRSRLPVLIQRGSHSCVGGGPAADFSRYDMQRGAVARASLVPHDDRL